MNIYQSMAVKMTAHVPGEEEDFQVILDSCDSLHVLQVVDAISEAGDAQIDNLILYLKETGEEVCVATNVSDGPPSLSSTEWYVAFTAKTAVEITTMNGPAHTVVGAMLGFVGVANHALFAELRAATKLSFGTLFEALDLLQEAQSWTNNFGLQNNIHVAMNKMRGMLPRNVKITRDQPDLSGDRETVPAGTEGVIVEHDAANGIAKIKLNDIQWLVEAARGYERLDNPIIPVKYGDFVYDFDEEVDDEEK